MNMSSTKEGKKFAYGFWIFVALIAFEIAIIAMFFFIFSGEEANAGIGKNTTVITMLTVGNVYPEVLNISISPTPTVDLIANSTKNVTVFVIARDFNGEDDIKNISVAFYDTVNSSYNGAESNGTHYFQYCTINTSYGDSYEVNATCVFQVWYYARNSTWNAVALAYDNSSYLSNNKTLNVTINSLLAIGLPDTIDYGTVNATYVSDQVIANVTNFGNVPLNLTLSGYAVTPGDNLSMNCTLGATKNISVYYEKYNLTASSLGVLTLTQMEQRYLNLSTTTVNKSFNLNYRMNDSYNEAVNSTYWRIYVPMGVAGSCSGNIVFGAFQGNGT